MGALATAGKALVILVVVGLIVALIIAQVRAQERWEEWCLAEGGRVDSTSQWVPTTSYDTQGRPYTTTNVHYTYYCLSDDGGIIDIKG